MTVKMTYTRVSKRELTLTSAYFPYDSYEPNKGLREVIIDCCRKNCISPLDVTPVNTTLYGGAWTSTHEENV